MSNFYYIFYLSLSFENVGVQDGQMARKLQLKKPKGRIFFCAHWIFDAKIQPLTISQIINATLNYRCCNLMRRVLSLIYPGASASWHQMIVSKTEKPGPNYIFSSFTYILFFIWNFVSQNWPTSILNHMGLTNFDL